MSNNYVIKGRSLLMAAMTILLAISVAACASSSEDSVTQEAAATMSPGAEVFEDATGSVRDGRRPDLTDAERELRREKSAVTRDRAGTVRGLKPTLVPDAVVPPVLEQVPDVEDTTVTRDRAGTVRVPDIVVPLVLERIPDVKDTTLGLDLEPKLSMGLQAVGYCDEVKPRVPLAGVTWKVDREADIHLSTIENMQTNKDLQRLDVTAYKRGFEKGPYLTLAPIREDERFRDPNPSTDKGQLPRALLNLTVEQVDWGIDTRKVVVGHLEPGINYFWRVLILHEDIWMNGGETLLHAPVCVFDEAEKAN